MPGPSSVPRPELVALGQAVRRHREARSWTPAALAEQAGVSRRTIGNIESGAYSSGIGAVLDVAHALGIRLTDLVSEAGIDPD